MIAVAEPSVRWVSGAGSFRAWMLTAPSTRRL